MPRAKKTEENDSTEAKIKEAARRVFTEKGYAATRTRDIAEASGYNLALINYYFRSKEKLFDIIMLEQLQLFVHSVAELVDDRKTTLTKKIDLLAGHYIDMLIANPSLPFFIMNEINRNPEKFVAKIGVNKKSTPPYIVTQWKEFAGNVEWSDTMQLFVNLIAMTVFPFIASPMLRNRTGMSAEQFNRLMEDRKTLIPAWMKLMINDSMARTSAVSIPKSRKK